MKSRFFIKIGILFLGLLIVTSCATKIDSKDTTETIQPIATPTIEATTEPTPTAEPTLTADQQMEVAIKNKLASMSIEEKVAQLFITTPNEIADLKTVTKADQALFDALDKYPVGGLIYFADNIVDPEQITELNAATQQYASELVGVPIFLSVDEEGGLVSRIANNSNFDVKKYKSMQAIGETNDSSNALEAGTTIGSYLSDYGFNLDYAPDADVITNSENTVIGNRSFGTSSKLVTDMANSYANGLLSQGILPCYKHFPDHGATLNDTHVDFAYTDKTLVELKKNELVPFQSAIDNKMPIIMVSHISVPQVTNDDTPSSLSETMITDILRNDMGYQGLIITDSLCMGAIRNNYSIANASVMALKAGVDMIMIAGNKDTITKDDFTNAYQGVLSAVTDGTINLETIDNAVTNILRTKYTYLIK